MKKILSLVLMLAILLSVTSVFATSTDAVGGMEANWWVDADVQKSDEFYVDGDLNVKMVGIHYNQYPVR